MIGARALGSLLFGVRSTDPITYAAVIFLVLIVVAIASYAAARAVFCRDPAKLLTRQ